MLKKLLALSTGLTFVDSTASSVPVSSKASMRCLDIISPPQGVPSRIEWDLKDPKSMIHADQIMHQFPRGRMLFRDDGNGSVGKRLKEPDLKENMVSLPIVIAG